MPASTSIARSLMSFLFFVVHVALSNQDLWIECDPNFEIEPSDLAQCFINLSNTHELRLSIMYRNGKVSVCSVS